MGYNGQRADVVSGIWIDAVQAVTTTAAEAKVGATMVPKRAMLYLENQGPCGWSTMGRPQSQNASLRKGQFVVPTHHRAVLREDPKRHGGCRRPGMV